MIERNPIHGLWLAAALALSGCGGGGGSAEDAGPRDATPSDAGHDGSPDAGPGDAGAGDPDAGPRDAGGLDAGPMDAGAPDAGPVDAGGLDAGPMDAATDAGPVDAGPSCGADERACHGGCIPADTACGLALPDASCSTDGECGEAGQCVDSQCVCTAGYRSCLAGCCPVSYDTTTLDGVDGRDVQLEFGPDGTAYVMVKAEVGSSWELHLHTRGPAAGAPLERASLSIPVSYDEETFDFAVRSDGVLFAAVAPTSGESSPVELHRWTEASHTSETIGGGFGYDIGIGLTIDADDTVWVSWSHSRSGGLDSYSLATDGVERTATDWVGGTVEQSDVEHDPAADAVYSLWGHRYTGDFRWGTVTLSEDPDLADECPADDAAFDDLGRLWTVHDSYSTIRTYFCRDGDWQLADGITVRGTVPSRLDRPRITTDAEHTGWVADYDYRESSAYWLASNDFERWSRGELPVRYAYPDGSFEPGRAYIDVERAPSGRVSFAVVPRDESMGPLTLVDLVE